MEITELLNDSIENLETEFYSKPFDFSYSSLSKLLWSPVVFHQIYVMGLKEERQESHLVQGKIIHGLLLEPEKFNDQFIVSPDNLPTGNPRTVVDRVFAHHQELARNGDERIELSDFGDAILDVMKDMNYHQNLKTDQQRLDKILTNENMGYWNFLRSKGNKTLISQEDLNFCSSAVEIIKTHEKVCKLIGCSVTDFDNKEVFNELALKCKVNDKSFGLKGIIDNVVIDHDEKVIYINDIKTTSKDLKDFKDSVEFYNYWMQACIYFTLITTNFLNLIDEGYEVKMHFVVIDRTFQVYPFPVSDTTMHNDWFDRFIKVLDKAEWHYRNKDYNLPYDFATGSVVL